MKTATVLVIATVTLAAAEPTPRKAAGQAVNVTTPLSYISGVAELPDGRLIVSDHKAPRVAIVDPRTGDVKAVGSSGANAGQYVRPGGFYGIPGKGFWMLDRGLTRVSAVSATGELSESKSILPRGSSGSSDGDYDIQRLDSRGLAYYFDRGGSPQRAGTSTPIFDLIRFDPTAQTSTPVAKVQQPVTQTIPGGDGMTFSRSVIGSPADGWGVAADGRVAVVRAAPYRVDWYSAAGVETRGPEYPVDVLPMTEADKQAFVAANPGRGASVGMSTARDNAAPSTADRLFADTKPPFDPQTVMVSPGGRVFVLRTVPAGSTDVIYDVFDGRGQRIDRFLLPATSRIVGFGPASIYTREGSSSAGFALKKYEVK